MQKITDENELMLVSNLYEILKELVESGKGNYKIKIGDRYLYEDEYGVNYMNNEIRLHGCLYHEDIVPPTRELKETIEKAFDKWYRHI